MMQHTQGKAPGSLHCSTIDPDETLKPRHRGGAHA